MKYGKAWRQSFVLGAVVALILSAALSAQSPTGNLFGRVSDEEGAALPGVQVTLSGIGATKVQITDTLGQVRFLALDPGMYSVTAELEGFGGVQYPDVEVRVNRSTTLPLTLTAAVEETITVTAETPLLDERKLQQGATVSLIELEKIPTARDPWAILNQTPGVLVDRVNVGGNESGQQAAFRAQGVDGGQNDFLVDGVSITDMRATGASPTYYDFDQFAEMQFTTGGTDVTKNTAGVSVNLVTKRGSNAFRGSVRMYNTKAGGYFNGGLPQAQPNVLSDLQDNRAQGGPYQSTQCPEGDGACDGYAGAQIREIEDMGFEAGGAVVQDRFWLWGSWGQNNVQQNAASGTADDTILENQSLKANVQFSDSNSAVASWNNGDKQKFGRGAALSRPDITTWNQRGPSAIYRFEDTHVFSSNLFLTGTYSLGDFGFQLAAKGGTGPDAPESWRSADGVWQDNFLSGGATGPNDEYKLDASYFFNTGGSSHELKVGGRFRTYETSSDFTWPGRNIFTFNSGSTTFLAAKRGISTPVTMEYQSLWAQDTISRGKYTINVGVRFDDQSGQNEAAVVGANPLVPLALPALNFPGIATEFSWESITPRIGFTYALGDERDTLLRASFSQFADQLGVGSVNRTNPAGESYAYFFTGTQNLGGPYTGDGSDLSFAFPNNYDPSDPASLVSPNQTDQGLDAPITTEFILQVEHALLPEFVIGATVTLRDVDDILEARTLVTDDATGMLRTLNRNDYQPLGGYCGIDPGACDLIDGTGLGLNPNVPVFGEIGGYTRTGGSLLMNGDRGRTYQGAAVTFTKRLANQWMMRGYVNYGEAEWDIGGGYTNNSDPNGASGGGDVDGQLYLTRSTGSGKGERFLQSSWTANLNGLYQVAPTKPWGFNIAASIQAREGYPTPYIIDGAAVGDGISRDLNIVPDFDSYRLDDLQTIDLRIEKEFALNSDMNFTFGIDAFNITNEGTPMSRIREANSSRVGFLNDNVSPRIYRLGVRLGWK